MSGTKMNNRRIYVYLALLTGVLTYVFYHYHASRPPDSEDIERCNALADAMPEGNEAEINRSINTFLDCLGE